MSDRTLILISNGALISPFDLPSHIHKFGIREVAYSLSKLCRFGGHCGKFYSVAEHSYYASHLPETVPDQLAALLHDTNEFLLGDWPAPLKNHPVIGPLFRAEEEKVQKQLNLKFGLRESAHRKPEVLEADLRMLATEKRDLMQENREAWPEGELPDPVAGWDLTDPMEPREAYRIFLRRYNELTGLRV